MKTKIIQNIRKNIEKIKIPTAIAIISFLIASILLFGLYFHAEEQYSVSMRIEEDLPKGVVYNPDFTQQALYWKNLKNHTLESVSVPNVFFFKTEKMDNMSFTITREYNYPLGRRVSTILLRGIKYNNLPFVYDYKKEIDMDGGNPNGWIYSFNKFSITKTEISQWVLTVEYKKENVLIAIFKNFLVAIFIGIISWGVALYVSILAVLLQSYKHLK